MQIGAEVNADSARLYFNLARPQGFQRGFVLLRRDARAQGGVNDQIRFRKRGFDEQRVGNDANIRAYAAKLDGQPTPLGGVFLFSRLPNF